MPTSTQVHRRTYTQHMTDCWSRGLNYADYKHYAITHGLHVVPEAAYALHCQAMDIDLEANTNIDSKANIDVVPGAMDMNFGQNTDGTGAEDHAVGIVKAEDMLPNMTQFGTVDIPNKSFSMPITRVIPLSIKYEIRVSESDKSSLCTADGTEWQDADDALCDDLLMSQFVQMYDLLHAINVATNHGVHENQFPNALAAVCKYFDRLPK